MQTNLVGRTRNIGTQTCVAVWGDRDQIWAAWHDTSTYSVQVEQLNYLNLDPIEPDRMPMIVACDWLAERQEPGCREAALLLRKRFDPYYVDEP